MDTVAPPLYPISLSLAGQTCLVAGFGQTGRRKISGLLPCAPALICVLDIASPSEEALPLLADNRVKFEQRACTPSDIDGKTLVFAATNDARENARIAGWCRDAKVLCNSVSAPESGSFYVPATARRGCLEVALSTGGGSPALAKRWRAELTDWLAPRAQMACLMGRLRPLILALNSESAQNSLLFHKLANSPLQQCLADGDTQKSRALLMDMLPQELHCHLAKLLTELSDAVS
jgi:precorrin-2 dehydrogenase/sirohydrochlorin ferrochelatase